MPAPLICSVSGCDKKVLARGWCRKHYWRWKNHGDPLRPRAPSKTVAFIETAIAYRGDECLFWPFSIPNGSRPWIKINGIGFTAARLVCERAHGPPPSIAHEAAHSCGKGHLGCMTPKHLRWATKIENQADRLIHGTHSRGERSGKAKLSEIAVREIRANLASGESQRKLATRFGVTRSCIKCIHERISWTWLT